jgi:hypothetical protein
MTAVIYPTSARSRLCFKVFSISGGRSFVVRHYFPTATVYLWELTMGLSAIAVFLIASGQAEPSDRDWIRMQSRARDIPGADFSYPSSFLLVSQFEI